MASGASTRTNELSRASSVMASTTDSLLMNITKALASLKLTVFLFALSILLVFFGTLAQDKIGIWDVMSSYFRSFFVYVPFNLIPQKWAPGMQNIPFGFWFVGGRTLGVLLAANLLAAHLVRFKTQAKGQRLWLGWGVFAAGIAICGLIITYGNLKDGVQDRPWFDWSVLWWAIVVGTVLLSLVCVGYAIFELKGKTLARILSILAAVSLGGLVVGLAVSGNRLDDAALRILWQLIQGTIGGLVLLAGCLMVFKKRAGIVLLHLGVGLLLYNELFVSLTNVEEQITLVEGEESNVARDTRYIELAIVDRSDAKMDKVLAVPAEAVRKQDKVELESLPFDIRVDQFMKNSALERIAPMVDDVDALPQVTQGIGLDMKAVPLPPVAGAESGNNTDVASAYVSVLDKEKGLPIATVLLPQEDFFNAAVHPITIDDKTYYLSLRFKQTTKPYSIKLLDVERVNYVGTSVPKEYWSKFLVYQTGTEAALPSVISMNEPLRYSGETFYQSGYFERPDGTEQTTLQVVTNAGWMMPYVACMLVAIGMLAHFSITLVNVLGKTVRTAREVNATEAAIEADVVAEPVSESNKKGRGGKNKRRETVELAKPIDKSEKKGPSWTPTIAMLVLATALVGYGMKPVKNETSFNLADFGRLPVTSGGRVMPIDSLARNSLRQLQKQEVVRYGADKQKISSIKWLADVISTSEIGPKYRVFKIQDRELVKALELKPRSGFLYSYSEIEPKRDLISERASDASRKQESRTEKLEKLDEAFLDLVSKVRTYETLVEINRLPENSNEPQGLRGLMNSMLVAAGTQRKGQRLPLMVPTPDSERQWETVVYHEVRRAVHDLAVLQAESLEGDPSDNLRNEVVARRWAEDFVKDQLYEMDALSLATLQEREAMEAANKDAKEIDNELRKIIRLRDLETLLGMATLDLYQQREMRRLQGRGMQAEALQSELTRQLLERDFNPQVLREVQLQIRQIQDSTEGIAGLIKDSFDKLFPEGTIAIDNNRASELLAKMLAAYKADDAKEFNETLDIYAEEMGGLVPEDTPLGTVSLEYSYHAIAPFYLATLLYLLAFVTCPMSWILTGGSWRRATISVIVFALVIHTVGLLARIYISGRPPVTNLYSSAIFIGWVSVIIFLVIERITKISVGNVLGSIVGFVTLLLAYYLGLGEDTFQVMQAVLDTQFWLATHVVCITLGYGTTFVAGMLGIAYVVAGLAVPGFNGSIRKIFANLIYGTVCFSLLFSFVGTVLGGLWADDSWGRFWGWDPKENGALIIVIWNALVLHARWGGMIRERGLAVLAIGGNIVTAWSWFGTNQLGFGLHSYGFTEGVLWTLAGWLGFNLFLIGIGLIPFKYWLSNSNQELST